MLQAPVCVTVTVGDDWGLGSVRLAGCLHTTATLPAEGRLPASRPANQPCALLGSHASRPASPLAPRAPGWCPGSGHRKNSPTAAAQGMHSLVEWWAPLGGNGPAGVEGMRLAEVKAPRRGSNRNTVAWVRSAGSQPASRHTPVAHHAVSVRGALAGAQHAGRRVHCGAKVAAGRSGEQGPRASAGVRQPGRIWAQVQHAEHEHPATPALTRRPPLCRA